MMKKSMMYGGMRTDRYLETGVRDEVRDEVRLGRLYGRAKRRPINLTTKQSSELNSVGPETPKSMNFFFGSDHFR